MKIRNFPFGAILLIVGTSWLAFGPGEISAQSASCRPPEKSLEMLNSVNARQITFEALLGSLANDRLPIAFPGSLRKANARRIVSIVRENVSLREILDEMTRQAPEYRWSEANGLITVSAHDQMSDLLDLELKNITYDGVLFCGLEQRIMTHPQIAEAFKKRGLRPVYRELWDPPGGLRIMEVGGPNEPELVDLAFESITLGDLLNTIITRHYAKSWSFVFGEKGKTVSLRFYRLGACF